MAKDRRREVPMPSIEAVENERRRIRHKRAYRRALRSTIYVLVIVAAAAVLISSLLLPVLQISGDSMDPTLFNGDIIVLVKTGFFKTGDLCAFAWNNKTLIKRIIAGPGQWVYIKEDGTVYVGEAKDKLIEIDEPYVNPEHKSIGEYCDIDFAEDGPYQVPDDCYFAMGDKRDISVDSRNKKIGSISKAQIMGRVWLRVYPFKNSGYVR